jgi:hypothetical protein
VKRSSRQAVIVVLTVAAFFLVCVALVIWIDWRVSGNH